MGAGLPAMAAGQPAYLQLTHRYRRQASSHSFGRISGIKKALHREIQRFLRSACQPNSHFHSSTSTTTASTGRAMR